MSSTLSMSGVIVQFIVTTGGNTEDCRSFSGGDNDNPCSELNYPAGSGGKSSSYFTCGVPLPALPWWDDSYLFSLDASTLKALCDSILWWGDNVPTEVIVNGKSEGIRSLAKVREQFVAQSISL